MTAVRASRVAALLAALSLAVAGCTGSDSDDASTGQPAASTSGSAPAGLPIGDPTAEGPVEFAPCGAGFACSGELDGIPYDIRLPSEWNGTLLIYAHGLRLVDPIDPDDAQFIPAAAAAPGLLNNVSTVAEALLEEGYALAGAGSPVGGWSIDEWLSGVWALREAFVTNIGVPNRIHTWGDSLGAVVAIRAGQEQDWVTGTIGLCGLLGGLNANLDLALDTAVGVKALLAPRLKLTGFASLDEARAEFDRARSRIEQAAADPYGEEMASLQVIAAATELPTQTRTSDGVTRDALAAALVENLTRVMARATLERFRIEQELGGNPSTNVGVNYGARVTAAEAEAIDGSAGEGTTLAALRAMASLPAVEADPVARAAADVQFPTPAPLTKPILTLHTAADPVAIVANESLFSTWAANVSGQDIRWLNINIAFPPAVYPEQGAAPHGAGHCNFTARSVVGAVDILEQWVRSGRVPTLAGNEEAFGPDSGFTGPVGLPPWPQGPHSAG